MQHVTADDWLAWHPAMYDQWRIYQLYAAGYLWPMNDGGQVAYEAYLNAALLRMTR